MIVLTYLIGIILLIRLFQLQIVEGEEYRNTSNNRLTRESTLKAARGDLLDRTGVKLVTTKMGFSLELYRSKMDFKTLNATILKLINLLENNKDHYMNHLPLKVEPYEFVGLSEEEQKQWKIDHDIAATATAQQAFEALKAKYQIEEQNINDAYKIMAIRYEMTRNGFGNLRPITVSKDISRTSVNQIKEQSNQFPGASVITEPIVTYPYGNLASHILGYIGPIDAKEYEANSNLYDINDYIGKDGLQYTLEKYLKGQDGVRQIDMAVDGTITEEYIAEEAVAGNNVVLTIDANLQKATEKALENQIKKIASGEYGKKYNAKQGSAIVLNVKTGEVLALASYPDYKPELFLTGISQKTLDEYNKNDNLYNRVISGIYAPGSTFKMVSATAGLESGKITTKTYIYDTGVYPKAHKPTCWYWTSYHAGHGYLNLTQAIQKSCNYYFYELGYRTGIEEIAKYAKAYGLDRKTGIELAGEQTGIIATPEYVKQVENRQWQLGETLSAAIGQSYNSFTPIQMARYIAMLANEGKAPEITLIQSITDTNGNKVPKEQIKQEVNQKLGIDASTKVEPLAIKKENLQAILKGMKGVTSEYGGTAYYIFSDFPMDIAGKTGSAETGIDGKVNGWFTGFAPYENPEIAVVVLIENAGSGGNVAPAAKEILKEYFGMNAKKASESVTAIPSTEMVR